MINSTEISKEIRNKKLLVVHNESQQVIAEISSTREISLSAEFQNSLEEKAFEKIKHIAKYYDGMIVEDKPKSIQNDSDISFLHSEDLKNNYRRLMSDRPPINKNDIVILRGDIVNLFIPGSRNEHTFRIVETYHNLSGKLSDGDIVVDIVDTLDHMKFHKIPLENLILFKEYHENWYYVQNGYAGNAMYWWAIDSKGYTIDINKAHKFTEAEALSIMKNNKADKRRNEKIYNVEYINKQENAHITIIDANYLENPEAGLLK